MKNNPYFAYLVNAKRDLPVCLTAQELLKHIAVRELLNNPLTVTEIMGFDTIASPATIHRKVEDLLTFGLVEHVCKSGNRRTKYLVITNQSREYFENLGQAMKTAVKGIA